MTGIEEDHPGTPGTEGSVGIDGRFEGLLERCFFGIMEDPPSIEGSHRYSQCINGPVDKAGTPGIRGSVGIDGRFEGFQLRCFFGNVGDNPGTPGIEGSTGIEKGRLCRIFNLGTFLDR